MDSGIMHELKVASLAAEYGIIVSLPFGGTERYDQIWDVNGRLLKIQIKKCEINEDGNAIKFSNQAKVKYEEGEIDAIVTSYKNKIYYLPFEYINRSKKKTLFFSLPKDQIPNADKYNWAVDFEIEKQLNISKIF
ncbi:MAG: hypothetical protein J1F35_06565 [Erysipelotrichales bacterium]|nr:hypothetical protein [Erysipelotrichales bacterium]